MNGRPVTLAVCLFCMMGLLAGCSAGPQSSGGEENMGKEFGEVRIENVAVSIDQNKNSTFALISPVFSRADKAEPLRYVYDTSYLHISDDGVVTARKRENKTVNVRAECGHAEQHFRTVFSVEIKYIPYEGAEADSLYRLETVFGNELPVALRSQQCEAITPNTTVLIGDSFMDTSFIGEYMGTYAVNKDVVAAGMSSSSSYHWERAYSEIIGGAAPKNVAIHIGTNNFYDFRDSAQGTRESLRRMLSMMHVSYPTTRLYWFTITQRTDRQWAAQVEEVNAYMKEWCGQFDWVTCVDTSAKITPDMLRDGVHPKTEYYSIFTDSLIKAGCEIAEI